MAFGAASACGSGPGEVRCRDPRMVAAVPVPVPYRSSMRVQRSTFPSCIPWQCGAGQLACRVRQGQGSRGLLTVAAVGHVPNRCGRSSIWMERDKAFDGRRCTHGHGFASWHRRSRGSVVSQERSHFSAVSHVPSRCGRGSIWRTGDEGVDRQGGTHERGFASWHPRSRARIGAGT